MLHTIGPIGVGSSYFYPKFSPNGSRLLYWSDEATYQGAIYSVATDGGVPVSDSMAT